MQHKTGWLVNTGTNSKGMGQCMDQKGLPSCSGCVRSHIEGRPPPDSPAEAAPSHLSCSAAAGRASSAALSPATTATAAATTCSRNCSTHKGWLVMQLVSGITPGWEGRHSGSTAPLAPMAAVRGLQDALPSASASPPLANLNCSNLHRKTRGRGRRRRPTRQFWRAGRRSGLYGVHSLTGAGGREPTWALHLSPGERAGSVGEEHPCPQASPCGGSTNQLERNPPACGARGRVGGGGKGGGAARRLAGAPL